MFSTESSEKAKAVLFSLCIFVSSTFGAVVSPEQSWAASSTSKTIIIGGTGCALGGMKAVAEAFQIKHPDVVIKFVPSLGSGGGIKAVLSGSLDLALAARRLSDPEKAAGAREVEYGRTPFIFVAAQSCPKRSITLKQVIAIYRGETAAWPDGSAIRLVLRPEADADTVNLKGISPEMAKAVQAALSREGMLIAVTDQENADILGKVRGAFGAASLTQILSETRPLRVLALDGVAPSVKTLSAGTYPYFKVFYAVTAGGASPETVEFLKFLESSEGRAILTKTGHLVRRDSL